MTTRAGVEVVEYDPDWPQIFRRLKEEIWPSVRDVAIAIEHVGSTSIPGMAAKPVIDMDIVIASRSEVSSLVVRLETLGYKHRGNLGIEDREAFTAPPNPPAHHLYVCVENSPALRNHLAVRDYFRSHPLEALTCSALKKELAERFPYDRERYVEAKTNFILAILDRCGFTAEELDAIRRANRPKGAL